MNLNASTKDLQYLSRGDNRNRSRNTMHVKKIARHLTCYAKVMISRRVVDPDWFNTDPDPAFLLNPDPDPEPDPDLDPS
jgi:hypothetical protein